MSDTFDPFTAPPVEEVPLPHAPLVRVLAQVSFPTIVSINNRDFIGPFQEAIRDRYPLLRADRSRGIEVTPQGGVRSTETSSIWRFTSADGHWRTSLAQGFVALETTAYTSRRDFVERLTDVLAAFDKEFKPRFVDRFGLRYVDRITDQNLDDIQRLVRPEVLGIMTVTVGSSVLQATSEALFGLEDERVRVRWGYLPANATPDPSVLEPVSKPSWILDLDMFGAGRADYDTRIVRERAERYAERIYASFRWVVSDEFLRRYGGQP